MKKGMRSAKGVLFLLLIAALVCGGILDAFPEKSRAATSVKYNMEILDTATPFNPNKPTENNESPFVIYQIPRGSKIENPYILSQEGITFQMLVEKKAKTEMLKTGKATYYPVTIIAKTFKDSGAHYNASYGDETIDMMITTKMIKDAKGKLYVSGGDVDVSNVKAEKKLTQKIGDGTTDPEGSMIIPIMLFNRNYTAVNKGVTIAKEAKWPTTLTTGQSSTLIKGSKSALEGKTLPDAETSGILPTPLVGVPVDLEAGTGTLVVTECNMNLNTMMVGKTDYARCFIWRMKITPASK